MKLATHIYTTAEACETLNCGRDALLRMALQGRIQVIDLNPLGRNRQRRFILDGILKEIEQKAGKHANCA